MLYITAQKTESLIQMGLRIPFADSFFWNWLIGVKTTKLSQGERAARSLMERPTINILAWHSSNSTFSSETMYVVVWRTDGLR